ncbi:LOW QUALITY PROTEIN: hypothetical protein CVT26_008427 [Gymnopilus dilepis]|uniref:Uncharacterized protein n=1 Tax=Gymnopilus dilepis TaxID=231916 RepID=A0A409YFT3_9AGAR|nr:LOW QUALITY PROTEIN: hypothetical protein CVT26_008427 [Gymnopilus dilepis]
MDDREVARRAMESRRTALVAAARPGAVASSPPNAAAGSTPTSYVTPTTSTTAHAARAESSMARDRTVQPSSVSAVGVAANQIRPRAMLHPSTVPNSLQAHQHQYFQHQHQGGQDPTNSSYLSFQNQGSSASSGGYFFTPAFEAGGNAAEGRRAETITGAVTLRSSSSAASSRTQQAAGDSNWSWNPAYAWEPSDVARGGSSSSGGSVVCSNLQQLKDSTAETWPRATETSGGAKAVCEPAVIAQDAQSCGSAAAFWR